jgi:hypothetical protein
LKSSQCRVIKFERTVDNLDNPIYYFEILSSKLYSVRIPTKNGIAQINPMSCCSCEFSQNWSQTESNKEQKKVCKHIQLGIDTLIFLKEIKPLEGWEYQNE